MPAHDFADVRVEFFLGGLADLVRHVAMSSKYLAMVCLAGRTGDERKENDANDRTKDHRKNGHVTVEETDIAVGGEGENFDRIGTLADLPDDVFLRLCGGGQRSARPTRNAAAGAAEAGLAAGAFVAAIFGAVFVGIVAVARVFVEVLAAADGAAGATQVSLEESLWR